MELANQPGCHVWNEGLQIESVAEWTGACSSGFATGPGTLTWEWPPDSRQEVKGTYRFGRKHGHVFEDGDVGEGRYVSGKRNGDWILRYEDGRRAEGPYVNGERNGNWVRHFPSGNVAKGPFVNGKRHGDWIWTYPDGQVERSPCPHTVASR